MENTVPSKLSPSGYTPAGNKIHPTAEDRKANISKRKTPKTIKIKVKKRK